MVWYGCYLGGRGSKGCMRVCFPESVFSCSDLTPQLPTSALSPWRQAVMETIGGAGDAAEDLPVGGADVRPGRLGWHAAIVTEEEDRWMIKSGLQDRNVRLKKKNKKKNVFLWTGDRKHQADIWRKSLRNTYLSCTEYKNIFKHLIVELQGK